jgi:TolA-binding protein
MRRLAAALLLALWPALPAGAQATDTLADIRQELRSLGRLGQIEEACVTLQEVGVRYPGDPSVAAAEAERFNLGCS